VATPSPQPSSHPVPTVHALHLVNPSATLPRIRFARIARRRSSQLCSRVPSGKGKSTLYPTFVHSFIHPEGWVGVGARHFPANHDPASRCGLVRRRLRSSIGRSVGIYIWGLLIAQRTVLSCASWLGWFIRYEDSRGFPQLVQDSYDQEAGGRRQARGGTEQLSSYSTQRRSTVSTEQQTTNHKPQTTNRLLIPHPTSTLCTHSGVGCSLFGRAVPHYPPGQRRPCSPGNRDERGVRLLP
jgi:hypothetical protein